MMSGLLNHLFRRISVPTNCPRLPYGIPRVPRYHLHTSHLLFGVKPIEIKMPALSPTMTEGTIIKWLKKEGDEINPGDVLCEIQTDKAVISFEMEDPGILAKIIKADNSKDVKIGTLIALMVEEGENWQDVDMPATKAEETPAQKPAQMEETPAAPRVEKRPEQHTAGKGQHGPAVKLVLEQYGLEASDIPASGPHGVLLKSDVLSYVEKEGLLPGGGKPNVARRSAGRSSQAAGKTKYTDIPLSNMRITIAKRLAQSKGSIPHSYGNVDCVMDTAVELRQQLINDGLKVSMNDMIVKAVALALDAVPALNIHFTPEGPKPLDSIDVAVAVATPTGLITPIVFDAVNLSVDQISGTIRELAGRAKQNKLKLHEFQGGSFTISNLGMFGILEFSAIINPPQVAILAIGTTKKKIGVDGLPYFSMTSKISYDARAVDENSVCRFLEEFRANMENPGVLLSSPRQHRLMSYR